MQPLLAPVLCHGTGRPLPDFMDKGLGAGKRNQCQLARFYGKGILACMRLVLPVSVRLVIALR